MTTQARRGALDGRRLCGLAALLGLLLGLPLAARAVQLSEVCASNQKAYVTPDGESPDWIELYNPESFTVSLDDIWISDDEEKPLAHNLAGYEIAPGGYLLLCADGKELPFKLSASGCAVLLSRADGTFARVSVPPLNGDETYSLQPDGGYQVTRATPGKPNVSGHAYQAPVYVASPALSHPSGFYDAPFALTMDAYGTDRIYYTLDGSIPSEGSALYTGAIKIEDASLRKNVLSARTDVTLEDIVPPKVLLPKAMIVRALSVDEAGNRSQVITATYFIGFQNRESHQGIPILSLVADPYDLFDPDDGLYVLGKGYTDWLESEAYDPEFNRFLLPINYLQRGRETEIPVTAQLYMPGGRLTFDQALGLRIHGNTSRFRAKKSLRLYARSEYGDSKISFRIAEGAEKPEKLIVRNGGNNQVLCFIDAFAHELLGLRGLPISRSMPCIVFLNGEYWGLYNLREYMDENLIADFYGVKADDVILIKDGSLKAGEAGEGALYREFLNQVKSMTCETDEAYGTIDAMMDIDNYTEYLAGGLYIQITDWLNHENDVNVSYWRTRETGAKREADGRWRWIYQDMDVSCGRGDTSTTPVQYLLKEEIFSTLWTNATYRDKFLVTVMDIANFDCGMTRVNALLDRYIETYRPYMTDLYDRYTLDASLDEFDKQVEGIRSFFEHRAEQIAKELIEALKLDRTACTLRVNLPMADGAVFTLNEREATATEGVWQGLYFSGSTLTLSARDIHGYRFEGWYRDDALITTDIDMTFTMAGDAELTPRYARNEPLAMANAANRPRPAQDGSMRVYSGQWLYDALLKPEGAAALTTEAEMGVALLTTNAQWSKGDGFSLTLSTTATRQPSIQLILSAEEGAPERWRVTTSVDGATEQEIHAFTLSKGQNTILFELPENARDASAVIIRVTAAKKPTRKGAARVILESLEAYGVPMEMSLIPYRACVALCRETLGDGFEAPTEREAEALPREELSALIQRLYEMAASALARQNMGKAGDLLGARGALEGMEGYDAVRVTGQMADIAARVLVPADAGEAVHLYRVQDGALTPLGTQSAEDGMIALPGEPGYYLLLDREAQAIRCGIAFRQDALEPVFVENALFGQQPEAYLWMDVTTHTAYQERVSFALPDGAALNQRSLYMTLIKDGAASQSVRLTADERGLFTPEALATGTYLLLPRSLSAYRADAEFLSQTEKTEAFGARAESSLPLIIGLAALTLCAASLLAYRAWRARKPKKR